MNRIKHVWSPYLQYHPLKDIKKVVLGFYVRGHFTSVNISQIASVILALAFMLGDISQIASVILACLAFMLGDISQIASVILAFVQRCKKP